MSGLREGHMDEADLDNIERVNEEAGPPSLHVIVAIQLGYLPALPTGRRVEDGPIRACSTKQLSDGLEAQ